MSYCAMALEWGLIVIKATLEGGGREEVEVVEGK
jgi:hypothetical protein